MHANCLLRCLCLVLCLALGASHAQAASLIVSVNGASLRPRMVSAGSGQEEVSRFNFCVTQQDMDLRSIGVQMRVLAAKLPGFTDNLNQVLSLVSVNFVGAGSAGVTVLPRSFNFTSSGAGQIDFAADGFPPLPQQCTALSLIAGIPAIGSGFVLQSGDIVAVDPAAARSSASPHASSSVQFAQQGSPTQAGSIMLVKSYPVVDKIALTDTGLVSAEQDIYRYSVYAHNGVNIGLGKMSFQMQKSASCAGLSLSSGKVEVYTDAAYSPAELLYSAPLEISNDRAIASFSPLLTITGKLYFRLRAQWANLGSAACSVVVYPLGDPAGPQQGSNMAWTDLLENFNGYVVPATNSSALLLSASTPALYEGSVPAANNGADVAANIKQALSKGASKSLPGLSALLQTLLFDE